MAPGDCDFPHRQAIVPVGDPDAASSAIGTVLAVDGGYMA
jgi:hypothetical protein